MFRALILIGVLLAGPAWAGLEEDAAPLTPASAVAPAEARGAVVWLHGSYDVANEPRPGDPEWLGPLLARGYDLWHFSRAARPDPLAEGGMRLVRGLEGLRAGGYRRIVVAGFSRGAFIGMAALARADLTDAVIAVSPAAHGRRVERRGEGLAAREALLLVDRPEGLSDHMESFSPEFAARFGGCLAAFADGMAGGDACVGR